MEEFIEILLKWDEEERKEIIRKIEKRKKLNNNDLSYLEFYKKIIERRKNERNI